MIDVSLVGAAELTLKHFLYSVSPAAKFKTRSTSVGTKNISAAAIALLINNFFDLARASSLPAFISNISVIIALTINIIGTIILIKSTIILTIPNIC